MKILKALYTFWGVFMGTSVDYVKPEKRPLWPTHLHDFDEDLQVFLGGSGNCGILKNSQEVLLINCNMGGAAKKLAQEVKGKKIDLVITSLFTDYFSGFSEFHFEKIYGPGKIKELDVNEVNEKQVFSWGTEQVHLIPIKNCFSKRDIVVYLEKRKVLFLGGLYYNGIHPVFDPKRGLDLKVWLKTLEQLIKEYPAETYIPHEGDLGGFKELNQFMDYLKALNDPKCPFSYCRQNFDWPEIPSYTSLEENFDHARKGLKSSHS